MLVFFCISYIFFSTIILINRKEFCVKSRRTANFNIKTDGLCMRNIVGCAGWTADYAGKNVPVKSSANFLSANTIADRQIDSSDRNADN